MEVVDDEGFARIARSGMADAVAENAHAVHVVADGLATWPLVLLPVHSTGRRAKVPSAVLGTAPENAHRPRVTSLRVAFGSCQHFEFGFYGAHRHIAAEAPDLMIFLGDYIYEGPGRPGRVRRHSGAECRSLAQYRNRYALYRTDPDLQRLHAAVPWLVTFDDHEVDNDYAGGHPFTPEPGFLRRRAAAYRAFFEHMPLRPVARPQGGAMRLHAHFDFGRLARVQTSSPTAASRLPAACNWALRVGADCRRRTRADRTMLGAEQERWLREGIAATADRWNLIAQQTLMARAVRLQRGEPEFNTHTWDGYPAARRRLLRAIDAVGARSCVVLSGDAHRCVVSDLRVDFSRPRSPIVATELCGPSLTSPGASARQTADLKRANAHIHFAESDSRGYFIVEDFEPQVCRARFRALADVADPSTADLTLARFEVRAERPGVLERAET